MEFRRGIIDHFSSPLSSFSGTDWLLPEDLQTPKKILISRKLISHNKINPNKISPSRHFSISPRSVDIPRLSPTTTPSAFSSPCPSTSGISQLDFDDNTKISRSWDAEMKTCKIPGIDYEDLTLMLRNIPNTFSRDQVVEEIRQRGLLSGINFLYVPGDSRKKRSVGYCFINVTSFAAADRLHEAFQGLTLGKRICRVALGNVQGLKANIEAYYNNVRSDGEFQPLLLKDGVPLQFPVPGDVDDAIGSMLRETPVLAETPVLEVENMPFASTFMLRNIPSRYTRDMIVEEMTNRGVLIDIDFLYVPIDFRCQHCVGYCFVNLTSVEGVARFMDAFRGVQLDEEDKKQCVISKGKVQGLKANIEVYRNSTVMFMNEKYQPLLFREGKIKPFPIRTMSRQEVRQLRRDKTGVSSRPRRGVSGSPRPR